MHVQNENKNAGILSLVDISLNWQMRNTKIKKTHSSSPWTCLHRSQNTNSLGPKYKYGLALVGGLLIV